MSSSSASSSTATVAIANESPDSHIMTNQGSNPLPDSDDFSLHGREQIIEQDLTVITDKLDCQTDFANLLVNPNLKEDQELTAQIMKVVNIKGLVAEKSTFGTTVIAPGQIGIIEHNGKIEVAGVGRWRKLNWRSDWLGIYPLTQNIVINTLSIIRVNKGEYGLARQGGKCVILAEGLHCYNDRLFKWEKNVIADQEKIIHGTIDILRVPKGKYGLVQDNNVPKIIKSGFYVIDSNYFQYLGSVDMNEQHINHQTIHVLRVNKFEIAKVILNNKPMLLYEGNYLLNSPFLKYMGMEAVDSSVIKHSTITRLRVNNGQIALAWLNNNARLIDQPKIYTVDNPNFIFDKFVSAQDKMIALGTRRRITVYDGEVGVAYVKGSLEIMPPSIYDFDTQDRVFVGFLSTKQQGIDLVDSTSKDGLLNCDTREFVEVGIKAAVFFHICDPKLTLTTVGDEKAVNRLVKETAIATLQGIIRNNALNQVAQSKVVTVAAEKDEERSSMTPFDTQGGAKFFDRVHDEFIAKLHKAFKDSYGIEISNIRIESFKILNKTVADNISGSAVNTAATETQLANLESQRVIAVTTQRKEAETMKIKTEAEALKTKTDSTARNNSIIQDAETASRAVEIKAEADAKSIEIQARAKAKAIELVAGAEAHATEMRSAAEKIRAQNIEATQIGQKLALLAVQAEMVTKSLQGVQKMVYLPQGDQMGQWPLKAFGMNPMIDFQDLNSHQMACSASSTSMASSGSSSSTFVGVQ